MIFISFSIRRIRRNADWTAYFRVEQSRSTQTRSEFYDGLTRQTSSNKSRVYCVNGTEFMVDRVLRVARSFFFLQI